MNSCSRYSVVGQEFYRYSSTGRNFTGTVVLVGILPVQLYSSTGRNFTGTAVLVGKIAATELHLQLNRA